MNISEFKEESGWPCWTWSNQVSTPLGRFRVELQTLESPRTEPDDEMVKLAEELVAYAESHGDYILDVAYGDFRRWTTVDPGWLDSCGLPQNLGRDAIPKHVGGCVLTVIRDLDSDDPYTSLVRIVPEWDDEHGLEMKLRDGAIVEVSDMPFTLKGGVLVFEEEGEDE